jgi:HD-like signal output (HDOD) protein
LHDVGKIVLAVAAPQDFALSIKASEEHGIASWQAEAESMGIDHIEIGTLVSSHWRFPINLHRCINLHHAPWPPTVQESDPHRARLLKLMAIVRVANMGSHLFGAEPAPTEVGVLDDLTPLPSEAIGVLVEQLGSLLETDTTQEKRTSLIG